ncbi:MAG: hypothetical protein AAGA54_09330 [Myxococcota bacterium]
MTQDVAIQHTTLESYFFSEIERAQADRRHRLPTDVEAYVVGLLARYAKRTHVAGRTSRPLALDYLEARDQRGSRRAKALRRVGDRALYISGVVPQSMNRSPVGMRYVRGIGTAAYRAVASQPTGALAVLRRLAGMFDQVAEVISDVARPSEGDGEDLMGLYERWRREGSDRDLQRLIAAGVLIDPERSDIVQ